MALGGSAGRFPVSRWRRVVGKWRLEWLLQVGDLIGAMGRRGAHQYGWSMTIGVGRRGSLVMGRRRGR
jgi:hypothetical protein